MDIMIIIVTFKMELLNWKKFPIVSPKSLNKKIAIFVFKNMLQFNSRKAQLLCHQSIIDPLKNNINIHAVETNNIKINTCCYRLYFKIPKHLKLILKMMHKLMTKQSVNQFNL